ncbi:hypothetical protein TSTA_091050 [Talaromyces stipitatus ATCC 10500]|uniref:Uncharacterized protein n=1 Tax=Talaromyces stipitatus (strain ATCC 10500 / CBS 375.48 / QM 6759 / NRRL 1006) TaxID=441959 RepID=B8M1G9_TALSN|nr:uncharacterized protein TSTA_091050 [Talaromyces stipitatus ATCC 10500]EED21865.1 hypothetical protein TSTA_091050 [Talaromyces stipitatus ATCC 10500]
MAAPTACGSDQNRPCKGCWVWFNALCSCLKSPGSCSTSKANPPYWVLVNPTLITSSVLVPDFRDVQKNHATLRDAVWDFGQTVSVPRLEALATNTAHSKTQDPVHMHACPVNPAVNAKEGKMATPDQLYHVLFVTSHLQKDPNGKFQKLRITGTYVSLESAKKAAHQCLFDAGYELEWFKKYEIGDSENVNGQVVHAVAPAGSTYRVRVLTTPNTINKPLPNHEDGRIAADLYYVVQIKSGLEDEESRDINIEGVFTSYSEARESALRVLLDAGDGVSKDSFAAYDEAGPGQADCGYGDNIIVHAVGNNGENFLVSVVKGQVLESVRLAEASF